MQLTCVSVDVCVPFHMRARVYTGKDYIAHLELMLAMFLSLYQVVDISLLIIPASSPVSLQMWNFCLPRYTIRFSASYRRPRATWHDGFPERVVAMAKTKLFKTLLISLVARGEFYVIVLELANIVSNDHLAYIFGDFDRLQAISPSSWWVCGFRALSGGTLW